MRLLIGLAATALIGYSVAAPVGSTRELAGDEPRIFASPDEAPKPPPEKLAYLVGLYAGTGLQKPDYLATIDLDPNPKTYSQVIHRLKMPNIGDELHHFGWNACGSCHGAAMR